jgi:predicted nucleic acid-binding protein
LLISSFDSNLLVYAHNESSPEHQAALRFVEATLSNSAEQLTIAHQTLFELFSVLTSTAVFRKPLLPLVAWQTCAFYLTHSAVQIISYESAVLPIVNHLLLEKPQRGRRLFDLIFAATLKHHGVTRLYTRNVKHFTDFPFLETVNPL